MKNLKVILKMLGIMKIIVVDILVLKDNEVLIKVEYVGICGLDVYGFEFGLFILLKDLNQEIGLGYECVGMVIVVGNWVSKFKLVDWVNIELGVLCGYCCYCLEGKYNICLDVDFMEMQLNYCGVLMYYLCYLESFMYKFLDNMDIMEGVLVEFVVVGMYVVMLVDVKLGKKIVIFGVGCIGLMIL